MSKILYIEDELTKNIPAIKKMFEPLLANRNLMKQLDALESKKPVLASDVVNVCNKASELDVVYKFPVALTKAVHHHQDYDLIIIDRDLSSYDYSASGDKIKSDLDYAGLSDPGEKAAEYLHREGDLLLLILLRLEPETRDKIYFLADNAKELVRNSPELDTIMDITHFSADRILEKSTEAEKVISDVIADLPAFSIQNQYRTQCEILRKQFSEETVDLFIDIVRLSYVIEKKIDFMQKLRPLTEKFLVALAEKINDSNASYWDRYHGKSNLKQKDFINSLDTIDRRYGIGYNKNIRQCLFSLWQIPSDFASHTSGNPNDITAYTIQALLNQLCDVILWYDRAAGKLK
jgi:hypothetical protein